MRVPFCHLHFHTSYSLLDSTVKIKEAVAAAKDIGMEHLAITDHGVLYGAVDFYKATRDKGIKAIIGCEVYVAPRRMNPPCPTHFVPKICYGRFDWGLTSTRFRALIAAGSSSGSTICS